MKNQKNNFRIEKDSMGEVDIPKNALYGPQTQRAIDNFVISDLIMPKNLLKAFIN